MLNIPADLPEPQKQALFANIASQIAVTNRQAIKKSNLVASIESCRKAKGVYVEMIIQYWRDPSMNISFNVTQTGSGWVDYVKI